MILPVMPVIIITATLMATTPPSSSEIAMPMAVVNDLGRNVTNSCWLSENILPTKKILNIQVAIPDSMPIKIAFMFPFNISNFSYNGTAKHIVDGVSR